LRGCGGNSGSDSGNSGGDSGHIGGGTGGIGFVLVKNSGGSGREARNQGRKEGINERMKGKKV
jgi:hypothetical protein